MAGRRFYRNNNNSKNTQNKTVLNPEAMKISVADLGLSEATAQLLEKNNIKNAAELCIRTEKEMYKIQTLNKKILTEITNGLKKHGFSFRQIESDVANANQPQKNANGRNGEKPSTVSVSQPKNVSGNNGQRPQKTEKTDDSIASLYPAGKVDFLSTRSGDKQKTQQKTEQSRRVKEPPITSPLPVEEWRKIQRGLKWGFYDGMKTVINPTYDEVFHFKEGLACVELDEKCGFIDSANNVVIPIQYETAFSFSDGLAVVVVDGKCGYINKENETVFPCVYEAATPFEDGVARVKQAGKWGFLSKDGTIRWQ